MNIVEGEGLPDFVMLEGDIDENAFYALLAQRFGNKKLYTLIGEQIVSVNPFARDDALYSEKTRAEFVNKYMYEVPPHIYSLGDDTYRLLMQTKDNQCVLITGESGAGKTEASKIFMQYISSISKSTKNADLIKEKLLQSNPVLEAFGNAKTLRNDNSSRFGKYMEIQFDGAGAPMGGKIIQYLLEKSRVVTRSRGERSFHIFYILLSQPNLLGPLFLEANPKAYAYLASSECYKVDSIDDAADFRAVRNAMATLGWSDDDAQNVWTVLAAILHLGNVVFLENHSNPNVESVTIANPEVVEVAATLLAIPGEMLARAITSRSISTGVQRRNSLITVPLTKGQAEFTRDSLAKTLYERLFTWVVGCINKNIQSFGPYEVSIGVLDIYGFEIFDTNSFEQFCINYCNEKLQQLFIRLVLKQEQEEYVREGIEWKEIDYFNNSPICDLVERPGALLSLMDEAGVVGQSTPQDLLKKFDGAFAAHRHYASFLTARDKTIASNAFRIRHYAGDVDYCIDQFLDKNRDTFFIDLQEAVEVSTNPLVSTLFPLLTAKDKANKKRPLTAGTQFKNSVVELIDTLEKCQPHYIRCIKANDEKRGWHLDEQRVRHQIRYLNLVETVRVRKAGFCNRQPYGRYLQRYKMCSPVTWPTWTGTAAAGVTEVLKSMAIPAEDFRMGNSKLFIRRAATLFEMEQHRARELPKVVTKVQARWRGYIFRYHLERRLAATSIQAQWRGYKARCHYKKILASVEIQRMWRGHSTRIAFKKTKEQLLKEREERLRKIRIMCAANLIRFHYRVRLRIIRKAVAVIGVGYVHWKEKEYILKLIKVFGDAKTSPPNFGKGREFPKPWHRYPAIDALVKKIWLVWWGITKVESLTEPAQILMRQKILAMDLFKGKKPWNCARAFTADYLNVAANPKQAAFKNACQELFQVNGDTEILYADDVMKVNPKGKLQLRTVIVTDCNIYKYENKTYKMKKTGTPLSAVVGISVSRNVDQYVVIRCSPPHRDIVLDVGVPCEEERCSEFVTVLYEILQSIRGTPVDVKFNDVMAFNNSREEDKPGMDQHIMVRVNPKPTPDGSILWTKSKVKNEYLVLYNH